MRGDERGPGFAELVDAEAWQRFQDSLSTALGLGIRCLGAKGEKLAEPSNMPRMCLELMRRSASIMKLCGDCGATARGASPGDHPEGDFHCHAGLYNMVRSLRPEGLTPVYLVLGPVVLGARPSGQDLERRAAELRLETGELEGMLRELPPLSFGKAKAIADAAAEMLSIHLNAILDRQRLHHRLLEMAGASTNVFAHCRDTHDLAETLVETCFRMLRPTRASVLVLDEATGELVLRASRGLSEEIAKTARVRVGEGIAGLAAQKGERLVVSDEVDSPQIRERMSNPALAHSIVTPIGLGEKLFCVFCIAREQEAAPFDRSEIALLDQMIEKAEEALASLPPA